jgi:histidinol dehydrogenase
MLALRRLSTLESDFSQRLQALTAWDGPADHALSETVRQIIAEVQLRGDSALLEYTRRFDRRELHSADELVIPQAVLEAAWRRIQPAQRQALEQAAERIRSFHRHQLAESWRYTEADGTQLGQRILPLDAVGLYVPGGKAAYPSSVLMNAIPARVAGVGRLVMAVPTPDGLVSDLVLAAARIAEVDLVISVGGAQAIAALAYGTATVPRVDKIVGPGNIYVATAKRMVFGAVGIDMIAGPSEIVVVCDGETDPDWIAMDLFSQAEHDEDAQAILISPEAAFLDRVEASIERLLPGLERADIIRRSLGKRGALLRVRNLVEAAEVVNRIAPEHLELSVAEPEALLELVRHAGAVFLGRFTPEALGDYCAGPNHVLPTSRTARFSSPLGVYDFQKRSSIIHCSPEGAAALAPLAATLARGEGLTAHARSAEYRGLSRGGGGV